MNNTTLLFCLSFNIIDNRPYAIRAMAIAKILHKLNYNVIFLCINNDDSSNNINFFRHYNFDCYIINFYKTRNIFKLISAKNNFKNLFSKAINTIRNNTNADINCIFATANYDLMEQNASKFAVHNNIPIIYMTSEWYQLNSFYGKFIFLKYLCAIYMRSIKLRNKNVIVISTFLKNFYQKNNCHVLLLPSIVDKSDYYFMPKNVIKNQKIKIVYAGYPGKKDELKSFLLALCKCDIETKNKIDFYGYGFCVNDLVKLGISQNMLKNNKCVHICGKVSQEKIRQALSASDFTILFRKNTSNAKGGFSTKIVESMMSGVPLITNLTGDMHLYFNQHNSIIISSPSVQECKNAINRIVSLSQNELLLLKQNARDTALKSFEYNNYLAIVKQFMENLV